MDLGEKLEQLLLGWKVFEEVARECDVHTTVWEAAYLACVGYNSLHVGAGVSMDNNVEGDHVLSPAPDSVDELAVPAAEVRNGGVSRHVTLEEPLHQDLPEFLLRHHLRGIEPGLINPSIIATSSPLISAES